MTSFQLFFLLTLLIVGCAQLFLLQRLVHGYYEVEGRKLASRLQARKFWTGKELFAIEGGPRARVSFMMAGAIDETEYRLIAYPAGGHRVFTHLLVAVGVELPEAHSAEGQVLEQNLLAMGEATQASLLPGMVQLSWDKLQADVSLLQSLVPQVTQYLAPEVAEPQNSARQLARAELVPTGAQPVPQPSLAPPVLTMPAATARPVAIPSASAAPEGGAAARQAPTSNNSPPAKPPSP